MVSAIASPQQVVVGFSPSCMRMVLTGNGHIDSELRELANMQKVSCYDCEYIMPAYMITTTAKDSVVVCGSCMTIPS